MKNKIAHSQNPPQYLLLAALGFGLVYLARKAGKALYKVSLEGKTVLITGGSRGLGLAMAGAFASAGARLVICSRSGSQLENARLELEESGAEVLAVQADLRNEDEVMQMVQKAVDRFGGIDVLVNNAGVMIIGPQNVMNTGDYKEAMDANVWSALHCIKAVLPHFKAQGHIVNITSIGGRVAVPHMLPYSVSKFAMVGLSQGLSAELAKDGVKVTTVIPNLMRTGSPRNIDVKGDHQAEYAWFKTADSLLVLSQNAKSAAKRIVEAVQAGETEITLTLTAKLAEAAQGLVPSLIVRASQLANRLLPASNDGSVKKGFECESDLTRGRIAQRTDRAAIRYNQH